jgi:hypothetical protein
MDELANIAVLFVFGFVLFVLFLLLWAAFFTINH